MNSAYHRHVASPSELGNSTSRQLRNVSSMLVIPVGSTEQHGPHLPLDTDTRIASAVEPAAVERLDGIAGLLMEYGRSAMTWVSRLVFVNGHGGNAAAMAAATGLLRSEGRDVGGVPCMTADADVHAGHTEPSVLLHMAPSDVRCDEFVPGNTAPLAESMPQLRRGGMAAVSAVGVLGDPTTATASEGERIFAEMVEGCIGRIRRWRPDRNGMLT
ncbi:mycofactocin biosynthesis peptidyl-dipeptidase MftE [Mycobacterium sp. 141]|uniref:mycofactocin biosynthesis peptidyl-dipeptidase MftE n=1 Tax=Mycobacterium sp. 141 TaxID=1120797 RepID=UPI0018C9F135|nr:mycofactocin biosynthesis peptidyl-dipeptidase MftE [Mycobacterium sp. 141]